MSKVELIQGRCIPLEGNDIDTDRIIPARFLRCITFDGLGAQVFADDRTQQQGKHPFDLPQYQGATILVVNGNFGCGSSREHAPQALAKWGIKAIVGESFAEIFFGNCLAMGIPCVNAAPEVVSQLQQLLLTNPDLTLTLDLAKLEVSSSDFQAPVSLSAGPHQMFLSGSWDSCGQLVENLTEITATVARLPYLQWR